MRLLTAALTALLAATALTVALGEEGRADPSCPPPDGGDLPDLPEADADDGDWAISGRGWGHGTGMSQYGALGAALLGCTAQEILETYFDPAEVDGIPGDSRLPEEVRVSLLRGGEPRWEDATITAHGADLDWDVPDPAEDAFPDEDLDDAPTQPQGDEWTLEANDDLEAALLLLDDDEDLVWAGGEPGDIARLDLEASEDAGARVAESRGGVVGHPYTDGALRFTVDPEDQIDDDGNDDDGNDDEDEPDVQPFYPSVAIDEAQGVEALDRYLYGLREVPSSWEAAAQQAQAIAGRGFAAQRLVGNPDPDRGSDDRRCPDCHLEDSPGDQVFAPYPPEDYLDLDEDKRAQRRDWENWRDAVDATEGEVVVHEGSIASTFYSSSHGGQSEASTFAAVYGSDLPYLQPVDDSRWEQAVVEDSTFDNPRIAWTRTLTQDQMTERLNDLDDVDVGEVRAIDTPEPRGAGGRVGVPDRGFGGVEIIGDDGEATISGWDFTTALQLTEPSGLRSELFTVEALVDPADLLPRLQGPGRVETALAIAEDGWDTADEVLLASARDFPDALAATALAVQLDAPLLLSEPDALGDDVATTLDDLEPERVTLLGGDEALEPAVLDAAEDAVADDVEVRRLAGADRVATATEIAEESHPDGSDEATLALAWDFPDALAAGALAASSDRVPTLLSDGDEVPEATLEALDDLEVDTVHLVGGEAVLEDAVASDLEAEGLTVERFAGADRWETSAMVAEEALERDDRDRVTLASGRDYPDALAGGPHTARTESLLLLVPPEPLLDAQEATGNLLVPERFGGGWLLGGSAAVSDEARRDLALRLRAQD